MLRHCLEQGPNRITSLFKPKIALRKTISVLRHTVSSLRAGAFEQNIGEIKKRVNELARRLLDQGKSDLEDCQKCFLLQFEVYYSPRLCCFCVNVEVTRFRLPFLFLTFYCYVIIKSTVWPRHELGISQIKRLSTGLKNYIV